MADERAWDINKIRFRVLEDRYDHFLPHYYEKFKIFVRVLIDFFQIRYESEGIPRRSVVEFFKIFPTLHITFKLTLEIEEGDLSALRLQLKT